MKQGDFLKLDDENRLRALELRSFIIEAPAGAGKTELLTQRYLKLLAEVPEPEEIVAITFTNKAAAEMRGRVLQSLQDALDGTPVDKPHKNTTRQLALRALAHSKELGWDLLNQPARLRINTIDSLSSLLARQMPLLSRFGVQPAVSSDAALHYHEAARRTLLMLEEQEKAGPVAVALAYFDNDVPRLALQLADMLSKRDQWLHQSQRSVQDEAEEALRNLIRHDIARASEMLNVDMQQRLMPLARYAASNLGCDHAVALLLDWDSPVPATPEALALWRSISELLLTGDGSWRKSLDKRTGFPATDEGRERKQTLLDFIATLPDPQPLVRIRQLPDLRNSDGEWRIVAALADLLLLAAAHLTTVFQEAGEVDFVEVSQRALRALEDESGPTDLAFRLDYRIQHLLVDEFQDTSPTQVKLLERLTAGWEPGDGRTLFCVGDPMQSIYRFRKAEVGLFLQAERYGIGALQLESLHLKRNNRSCPAVVDWVNQAFATIFPENDSETRGAIRYREFVATRPSEPEEGVFIHPLVAEAGSDKEDLSALEASYIATLIENEQAAFPGRTMAVLVRARNHLKALVSEIRRHRPHLRFQAVEVEALADRQTVQDVMTLTRALFHRADRVNWLAVLRAPWCGLTLEDMHRLAGDDFGSTVWQLMQDEERLEQLSANGQQRLRHVRDIIAEAFAHQARQSKRRWVESVWLKLGGAQCLWDAGDVRDVQAFLDLIEQLDAAGTFSPEVLETAMTELYAAPDVLADGRLQFMTLHKSKGLEFDTVILPGLHRQPKGGDSPLLLWEEVAIDAAEAQLVVAPMVPRHQRDGLPTAYDYLRGLETERAANEGARLLYVGATRSKRRLHLIGALSPNAKGEVRPPANTFLALLWGQVADRFSQAAAMPQATVSSLNLSGFIPRLLRLPHPDIHSLLKQQGAQPASPIFEEPAQAPDEVGSLKASCGSLAHLYLEMIAGDGLENWPVERIFGLQGAMAAWLEAQGHAPQEALQGAALVSEALLATLTSEHGQWVLSPRASASSELAVTRVQGTRIAMHVVDRTFVENGERWVIDFKSARLGDGLTAGELGQQAERYRAQLERYAGLFEHEGLPVRKGVFFIARGTLVELN